MKIGLFNRAAIQALSGALLTELDNLVTRIRASWGVQHGPEGEHTHVTAESIASGRLSFTDISTTTLSVEQANNFDPEGFSTAAIVRLQSSLATVYLTGLRVPQDESGRVIDGRVVVLENATQGTMFVLESESTHSFARNRFRTPAQADPTNEAATARAFLRPTSLLILIYNAKLARWVIHSQSVEENVRFKELTGGTTHDNLSIGNLFSTRTLRLSFDATAGAISGLVSSGIPETTRKTLSNVGNFAFDLLHLHTNSDEDNRFVCPAGVRYRVHPRETCEIQRTSTGWRIVEKAAQWWDLAYDAARFTTDVGTWTVAEADQTTLAYQLDGSKMTASFDLRTTSVSGNPTQLRIAVPTGRSIARTMQNRILAVNAGVEVSTSYVEAIAGQTYLRIFRDVAGTAWSAATDTTRVSGEITFMLGDSCADIEEDHADVAAVNQSHGDAESVFVPHGDQPAQNTHTDSPFVPHADQQHQDQTSGHSDVHGDQAADPGCNSHGDSQHTDEFFHTDDFPIEDPHQDHDDHSDVPAVNEHCDQAPISHSDSHGDQASSHSDAAHADQAAQQHADLHGDSVHVDSPEVNSGHSDQPAIVIDHEDSGLACATIHADQGD